LSAIAIMKATEAAAWMTDCRWDAGMTRDNVQVRRFLAEPDNPALRGELRQWMASIQCTYDLSSVMLLDAQGAALMAVPSVSNGAAPLDSQCARGIQAALHSRDLVFEDMHSGSLDGQIHFSFLVPVGNDSQTAQPSDGVLLFTIDPRRSLYPQILHWPIPSRTAEILLVRREGDDVVYLNDLRYRTNAALVLRLPVNTSLHLPAGLAVQGQVGVVEGDAMVYRGQVGSIGSVRTDPGENAECRPDGLPPIDFGHFRYGPSVAFETHGDHSKGTG
jgi:two-component system sensor histidine kinase/response regulator